MASRLKKRTLRWLIPVHRYLGLGMSLILLLWFASGIVMMFEGYPRTPASDRMAWLAPMDPGQLAATPTRALAALDLEEPAALRINQPGKRPRIHAMDAQGQWRSAFADTGQPAPPLNRQQARTRARKLSGAAVASVTRLDGPDQWTVNSHVRAPAPLWRVALADDAGTHLYLSRPTGEVIHSTTFHERVWGYAGPVIHWIYPTQLRQLSGVWRQVVLWVSGIGTLATLSGLILGLMLMRRNKRRGGVSPFQGLFRWHHYLGLAFGTLAATWVFSGLLSMSPFYWTSADRDPALGQHLGHSSPATHEQASAPAQVGGLAGATPRELQLHRFNGQRYYRTMDASGAEQLYPASQAAAPVGEDGNLPANRVREAAKAGDSELTAFQEQNAYDAYYYAGRAARIGGEQPTLPVYRATYDDGTRLYIDPATGGVLQHSTPLTRLNRWLYNGLHSLDFPVLNPGSVAWYALVLALLSGGTLLCLSATWLSVRYLWRRKRGR
ncbi:PepSY domain-containing protein [Halomonadaceae bacterium KBTZ08]